MPLVGNIRDLGWAYDHETARTKGSPIHINTPHMEVRVIVLKPGVYPPYHAHHEEMDEGYLIYGGRGLIHNGGETFEVEAGQVLLNPRGGMHHMKNIGAEDLIEFNFRGGRMPSGFLLPEGDPPPNPDPETVGNPARAPAPYIRGRVEDLAAPFDPGTVRARGLSRAFATEHLALHIIRFAPGDRPATHRHLGEVDEATLVLRGRVRFHIDGEAFDAGAGDLVHLPGGCWHHVENIGGEELVVFNILAGRLPASTEWRG